VANPSAEAVADAVELACSFYPRRAFCLLRSSVLTRLLRQRGIRAEMVIGVRRSPLEAHAWVEVNGSVLNDRAPIRTMYAVLDRV